MVDGHLIVAEDSEGLHYKSFLWAIDIKTRALTRIFRFVRHVGVHVGPRMVAWVIEGIVAWSACLAAFHTACLGACSSYHLLP